MKRSDTRRGVAILFSGVLVLGGLALAGQAVAGEVVDGNPTCSGLGYTHTDKVESPSGTSTVDRDGMTASLTVGTYADVSTPNQNNAVTGYTITTSAAYAVVVKGGDGATVYRSAEDGHIEAPPLHAPVRPSGKWPTISHVQLCWNDPAPPPETGRLQVTKVVAGIDAPDDAEFEICVTPAAGGEPRCTTIEGAGTVTFENLPPGDYVVTETDPGPMFSVSGSGVTVTVESDTTATATVTNTWLPPDEEFGRVEVTKLVTGTGAPIDEKYQICLTGPAPSTTRLCTTLVGPGTATFDDLVPGEYTATETDPGALYRVTIAPDTVRVVGGKVARVTVTNTYTRTPDVPTTTETPTVEVLPPTAPVTPVTPTAPGGTVAATTPTTSTTSTALPTTGSESGLAILGAALLAAGIVLTSSSRRRGPQQA